MSAPGTHARAALDPSLPSGPVDARLVPLALVVWATAGVVPVLAREIVVGGTVTLLGAGLVSVLAVWRAANRRRRQVAAASAAVLLGAAGAGAVAGLHSGSAHAGPVPELAADARSAEVEFTVDIDPLPRTGSGGRPDYVSFDATINRVRAGGVDTQVRTPVVVTAGSDWEDAAPGERFRTRGRFSPAEPGDRPAAVLAIRGDQTRVAEAGWVQQTATDLRFGLREAAEPLPPAERGLVPGLVVGDVALMPPELDEDFKTTNLTHLVAVSGSNLTILLAFVLGGARWLGARSWALPVLGLVCVAGFVLVARPEPSVLRAAAMGVVALAGIATGARRHGVPALSLAVVVLLLIDPWLARTYGFALSVLATAGILVLGPSCMRALSTWLPRWCAAAVTVPLVAQIPVVPVIAVLSGAVSVVSVVANLLAAVAVAPATILGVAATLLAPVSTALASVPTWGAALPAWWIVQVGTYGARLPGAEVGWSLEGGGLVLLVLVCVVAAVAAPVVLRRRLLAVGLAVGMVGFLLKPVALPDPSRLFSGWPPSGWAIVACDVGQGDGLVLRAGADSAVVVDTGLDPEPIDRCLTELGIRHVPYVLLTHFHGDHTGGLSGVLRGREVDEVGVTPVGRTETALAEAVAGEARSARVRVSAAAAGERRRAGDTAWTVLWPPAGRNSVVGDQEGGNDTSVVARADVDGIRVLLTGDVEPLAQRAILRTGADLGANVLKVPHHGSAYQDPRFLAASQATTALLSVGEDNQHDHPASSTLRTLRSAGMMVSRTDRQGAVAVVPDGDELVVVGRDD